MVVVDKIEVLVLPLFMRKMLVLVLAPQKTCILQVLTFTARIQSLYVEVPPSNLELKGYAYSELSYFFILVFFFPLCLAKIIS